MKTHYHKFPLFLPILFPLFLWAEEGTLRPQKVTSYFKTEEGSISYYQIGSGKRNFILLPGIGDLKESYNELADLLSKDGNVYAFDLRGLGESDVSFSSYGPKETAMDILSFIREKDLTNVYVIANSMTAASAVYIQSKENKRVLGMILSGPFVRDKEPMSLGLKSILQIAFRGPWGPSAWVKFYESLFPFQPPKDMAERKERLKENLKKDGRMAAIRSMLFASKKECEEALLDVKGNHIIIMGSKDPDFSSPEEEAYWIRDRIEGTVFLYENVGHYPFVEEPNRFHENIKSLWQKK